MAERFENDCLILLRHLAENEYQDLKTLERRTGISKDECRRYLLPYIPEKRKEWKLAEWKQKNKALYYKVLETVEPCDEVGKVKINTSKHQWFRKYAERYGYILQPTLDYPFIAVEKVDDSTFSEEYRRQKNRNKGETPTAGQSQSSQQWSSPFF